ncbi:MAG: TetR family transcriptional regulator [Marmoricola sp.]|nr:TetR family transcriptional regulator [Marmoricola sp.]
MAMPDDWSAMTSTRSTADPGTVPPRGTRPSNRRDLIREAAAVLFAEHGYAHVSLNEVADAVNIGRSAIYRHYPGKADLLYGAADSALTRILDRLPDVRDADLDSLVTPLVRSVLDLRYIGVLWQREARNLPEAERADLRRKVRQVNESLGAAVAAHRPELTAGQAELLAACAVDAVTSVSFHRLTLPPADFERLLVDLCLRVLHLEPAAATPSTRPASRSGSSSRSDQLIDASIRLFAENGYAAVSIDDIGAAVGIAGPSVYKHFESKHDLLLEAMVRGTGQLMTDLDAASADDGSGREPLRRISDAYVALALDHSDLIGTLIGETTHLDDLSRERTRKVQRAVIDDWVALLRERRPTEDATVARIKVQAAQMVANDLGRTPHLRKVPGFRQTVLDVCWELQQ